MPNEPSYEEEQAVAWADAVRRGDYNTADRISGKQNTEYGMYQRRKRKKLKLTFWPKKKSKKSKKRIGKQKYGYNGNYDPNYEPYPPQPQIQWYPQRQPIEEPYGAYPQEGYAMGYRRKPKSKTIAWWSHRSSKRRKKIKW